MVFAFIVERAGCKELCLCLKRPRQSFCNPKSLGRIGYPPWHHVVRQFEGHITVFFDKSCQFRDRTPGNVCPVLIQIVNPVGDGQLPVPLQQFHIEEGPQKMGFRLPPGPVRFGFDRGFVYILQEDIAVADLRPVDAPVGRSAIVSILPGPEFEKSKRMVGCRYRPGIQPGYYNAPPLPSSELNASSLIPTGRFSK